MKLWPSVAMRVHDDAGGGSPLPVCTWQDFCTPKAGSLPKVALVQLTVPESVRCTQRVPAP